MEIMDIIDEIRREQELYWANVSEMSGVSENTLLNWRSRKTSPNLIACERVLSALGYELEVVKK